MTKKDSGAGANIAILNEKTLSEKIYTIRGERVMLDFDLAKIYGYTTSAFNQQVARNIEKFDEDFRFQLTQAEADEYLRSQNVILDNRDDGILRSQNVTLDQEDYFRYLPYAFTESGIYMLMTVLRGDLAVRQSKALIRAFRAMKDYIVENQNNIEQKEYLRIAERITDVLVDFSKSIHKQEYLFLSGQLAKAAV